MKMSRTPFLLSWTARKRKTSSWACHRPFKAHFASHFQQLNIPNPGSRMRQAKAGIPADSWPTAGDCLVWWRGRGARSCGCWQHLRMVFTPSYLQQLRKAGIMCFFKKVEQDHEPIIYPCENQCFCYSFHYLPPNAHPSPLAQHFPFQDQYSFNLQQLQGQMATDLSSILRGISHNNAKIMGTLETLKQSQALIEQAQLEIEDRLAKSEGLATSGVALQPHCELNQIPFFSNQPLISKIFGQKQYKYKLNLAQPFPKIIYKERNLNIAVKLANPNSQALCNANLIHLCIGVCNSLGQWIVEESGDFFMQGKIEIDLYHGEAEFKKISPKDVSRHFNGGLVNLVIYPKKSLINFTGEVSKYEKEIDCQYIEPLVIRDIVIKAKKKCRN